MSLIYFETENDTPGFQGWHRCGGIARGKKYPVRGQVRRSPKGEIIKTFIIQYINYHPLVPESGMGVAPS